MKSSQIVEMDKEQKQKTQQKQTTAGETIRDKAEYSVQWEITRADARGWFFFLVLRLGKEKNEQQKKHISQTIFLKHSPPASNKTRLTIFTHKYLQT